MLAFRTRVKAAIRAWRLRLGPRKKEVSQKIPDSIVAAGVFGPSVSAAVCAALYTHQHPGLRTGCPPFQATSATPGPEGERELTLHVASNSTTNVPHTGLQPQSLAPAATHRPSLPESVSREDSSSSTATPKFVHGSDSCYRIRKAEFSSCVEIPNPGGYGSPVACDDERPRRWSSAPDIFYDFSQDIKPHPDHRLPPPTVDMFRDLDLPGLNGPPTDIRTHLIADNTSSAVFEARVLDRFLGCQTFAVKCMERTDENMRLVSSEAAIYAALDGASCRFTSKLHSSVTSADGKYTYFIMEFYPYSLANMIHTCPVSAFQARTLAAEILIGIEELHALGILHCDLKPDNILISQKGHAVVADFGLCERARLIPGVTAKLPRLIASRGTEGYMAPEVLRKFDTWSGPADLWAFGCILYDLHIGRDDPFFLHGRWPEARQSITATLAFRPDFAYMSWLLGDRDVADLICQLWHPLPKERPTIARIKAHPYFRRIL